MVQALAQELISLAKKNGAQDIYLVPKNQVYELHMRIGDERRLIDTYDFEKLGAVISHFKFIAGMNVGEKRRSQLGSCDYHHGDKVSSLRLSTVGDYRGYESLVIRLLHDQERELYLWFRDLKDLEKGFSQRGL